MEKHKLLGLNKDGSTPARGPRGGMFQPNHAGLPTPNKGDRTRAGAIMDKEPAANVSHRSHGYAAHLGRKSGNIALDGKPKHTTDCRYHGGMTERQHALAGMGHANATAPDANPASPLSKEPQGKRLPVPQPVIGHRSRVMPHSPGVGNLIMKESLLSFDDALAFRGRVK